MSIERLDAEDDANGKDEKEYSRKKNPRKKYTYSVPIYCKCVCVCVYICMCVYMYVCLLLGIFIFHTTYLVKTYTLIKYKQKYLFPRMVGLFFHNSSNIAYIYFKFEIEFLQKLFEKNKFQYLSSFRI